MENIRIYAPGDILLLDVPVTAKSTHEQELMKSDHIHLEWSDSECVNLPLGAYVRVDNIVYTLAKPYYPDSRNMGKYDYSVDFEHELMLLQRVPFLLYREDGVECDWNYTGLFQDLKNALKQAISKAIGVQYDIRIDDSANRAISLSFSNTDIFSALNSIADALECEWWYEDAISGTRGEAVIDFGPKCVHENGEDSVLELTAGQEVGYPSSNNKGEFFNRFFVFGSTRNIPQDYEGANANTIVNKRLTLDPFIHPEGYMDLPAFDINGNIHETTGTDPNGRPFWKEDGSLGYYRVDQSVTDGVRTFTKVLQLDDIYPRADLHVAHVAKCVKFVRDQNGEKVELTPGVFSTFSVFYVQFADVTGKVFDINPTTYQPKTNPDGHVLPNTTPGIHFNSGALTGREFEVFKYHEGVPTIRNETDGESVSFAEFGRGDINAGIFEIQYKEDNTIIIPNDGIEPIVSDKAVVFNIRMPEAYVTKGYKDLDQAALVQIYEATKDGNEYTVQGNSVYFAENEPGITIGRHVYFYTQGRKIDTRVVKITRNLDRRFEIELAFGKSVMKGTIQTILTNIESTQQSVVTTQLESRQAVKEAQKRAYDAQRELHDMIFDADDYFKDGNIKPATIETLMLSVGAVSSNLELSGVTFIANSDGTSTTNPNAVLVSQTNNAKLIHFGISESEVKEWNLTKPASAFTRDEEGNAFASASPYYLYARCASNGNSGSFVFSLNKYQYNQFVETNNVYYFLIGVLSSVIDGYRILNTTYGNTAIVGNQIRTGVIKSNAENMEIDLDNGVIWSENGVEFRLKGQRRSLADYATETDSAIEATSEKVDNIKIGGRNLSLLSKGDSKQNIRPNGNTKLEIDTSLEAVKVTTTAVNGGFYINKPLVSSEVWDGTNEWVISVWVKRDSSTSEANLVYGLQGKKTSSSEPITTEWKRFVIKGNTEFATAIFYTSNAGIYYFKQWQLELGNQATDWTCAPEDIDTLTQAKIDEVNRGIQQQLEDLESQIDNEIEYYFDNYQPTASNAPANAWTTEELKKAHIGDIFYRNDDSTSYKWGRKDNVYQWLLLENDPSAKAMALAQQALTEVGDKSAVIFGGTQPKTPYQKGDMWSRGSYYPILICTAEGTHTTYNASHWEDATSYIDSVARQNASDAVNTANSASNKVDNLKIGGGNLYKSTSDWIVIGGGASISKHDKSYNGRTITTTSTNVNTRIRYIVDQANVNYAISFNVLPSVSGRVGVDVNDNSSTGIDVISNTSKRVELVLNTTRYDPSTYNFIDFTFAQIGTYKISNLKIEKSDKCTSWSPAPEDVEASIKEAYDLADTAKNNAKATDNALKAVDSDGIFSTIEKRTMRPQWQAISGVANTTGAWTSSGSAKNVYDNAISAGYTSSDTLVKAVYDNFVALRTYLNGVGLYSDSNFTFTSSYTRAQLSSKFQDYHKAEVALSEATASKLASNAQTNATNNAKNYTDGQVTTLNGRIDAVAQTANNAYSNASQYEYLKQAIAEAERGTQAEGYSVVMSGGAVLSNVLEARNTSGKVTAGVSGLDSDNGDSLAFWAGAERTDGSIPFSVTHSGEVTMSKARITSGSNTGSQVTIASTEGGNVGAIMVGSQGGADTQILGKASGGIEGMKTNAGIGGSSSNTTISATSVYADNIFTYKEATFTQQGHPTNPKITPSPASQTVVKQMTLLNNPSKGGVITLGNISFSNRTSNPSLVGTGAFASNSNNSANIYEQVLVDVLVGNNKLLSASGNITLKYKNATATISESLDDIKSTISGKKVTFGAGESVIIKITKTSTLSCFSSASNPNLNGTLTASGGGVYTTFNIAQSSYVMQMFNNVVYNDGMFMSRASNRYIAMSPASSDKIMEMVCGERGMAFTSAQGLGLFARLSSGIDKSKINSVVGVLWYGRFVFNNATISKVENWGGSLSLTASSISRANSMITISYGITLLQVPTIDVRLDTASANDWTAVPRQITTTQCKLSVIQGSNANYTSGAVIVCIKQI